MLNMIHFKVAVTIHKVSSLSVSQETYSNLLWAHYTQCVYMKKASFNTARETWREENLFAFHSSLI